MKSSSIVALLAGVVIGATAVIIYEGRKEMKSVLDGIIENPEEENSDHE